MPEAVVLDFDGVVLESVDVKTRAFAALFEREGREAADRIVAYHVANGGISRYEKFRWAYREVLRRPLAQDEEERLGAEFNRLVEEAVVAAEWVPGAREFLESHHGRLPLYVASGTPQDELRRIVRRRDLERYFRGVYGAPDTKDKIIAAVAADLGCPPSALVMVGDAINDLHGAEKAGARFIGRRGAADFPAGTTLIDDLRALPAALGAL